MYSTLRLPAVLFALAMAFTSFAQTEVDIEKFTNGMNADIPPGPVVTVGSTVNWTYVVTNTSSRPLSNIVVTDDQGVTITCPATTLDAGTSFTCTASGPAVAGQYANVGTVTAETPDVSQVFDSDPSHYFGQAAAVMTLEKSTNGFDADTAPGPSVPVGSAVNWTYEVTNTGSEALMNVTVTDDQGVAVSCPATDLDPGESMICTASGFAIAGQYANLGTATANLPDESPTVASDPSHYYGQTLLLVKRTNGVQTDAPPGPTVAPGSTVQWTYEVTNPGPATVTGLSVTDDQGVTVSCATTTLAAGESVVCTGSGTAIGGQYINVATATATLPAEGEVSATDTGYYFGNPISIEKTTNGVDADLPPGPAVSPGSTVNWEYIVTNVGADALTDVIVTDDQGVTVTCPTTTLAAGESMTCTGSGVAITGQYANVGTVEALGPSESLVSASDPSHYFGQNQDFDFGDAPDPTYQTLLASNGARHLLGGTLFLGVCVDAEADGLAGVAADQDDASAGTVTGNCVVAGDDEDGVTFTSDLRIGLEAGIDVVASEPCTLSAWIDFNRDGDWGEASDDLFPGGTALAAGSNSLTFTVPAGASAGGTFARFRCTTDGSVAFTGEASDGEVEDYGVTLIVPTPQISATKTDALVVDADSDGLADPGDTLRYTIVITNGGTGDATSVVFTDTPDANTALVAGSVTTTQGTVSTGNTAGDTSVAVAVGTLVAYGGAATVTFDVIVDDPLAAGVTEVSNQGSVSGGNFDTTLTNTVMTPINRTPAVTATKADALLVDVDSDGLADPGDTLRYTIVITNGGTGDATSVVFTDTPDANTTLAAGSVTTTQGSVSTGNTAGDTTVAVAVGTLAAYGGSATISFDVVVDDPLAAGVTEVSNQGSISGDNFDTTLTNAVVTPINRTPAVTATKADALLVDADSDGLADPGDTIRYTVVITNGGSGDATAVVFTDTPDANTALVAGSVTTTQGSISTGNTAGDPSVAVAVGTLAAYGGSATISFDVVIDDPLAAGVTEISNQGSVSGDNFTSALTNAVVTPLNRTPVVTATKADALFIDADGDGLLEPGDTIRYTIVITNGGSGDATDVVFTDTPDANTALAVGSVSTTQGSVTTGNTAGDTTVAVAVGTLAAYGGSATILFDVTVDDPLAAGVSSVSNQGTVAGSNFTSVSTNTAATSIALTPLVSATKTVELLADQLTLRYTITILNSGSGEATDVLLTDTPDGATTLVAGSVTTTQGIITTGNTAGDTTVAVDLGTLPPYGGTATIVFDVTIDAGRPDGLPPIVNSGALTGSNFAPTVTDDPSEPGPADPTIFAMALSPGVPTLQTWALLALLLTLAGFAVLRLRV